MGQNQKGHVWTINMKPYLLFYTDNIPSGSAGCANAFVIRIRPEYKNDEGILRHEAEHVRQWWCTLGLHSLLYLLVKSYRLYAEVRAYREQLKYLPAINHVEQSRKLYAGFISRDYGLDISVEEAENKLRR